MLLNKIFAAALIISISFLIISCGDSEEKKKTKAPLKDYSDPSVQLKEAKNVLGNNTKVTYFGTFDEDKGNEIVAGSEINTKSEWGIKFAFLDISGDKPKKVYETGLLEGSLNDSRIEKMKLPSVKYDLLYYNSADYFVGSGGGEVFSYIIDFEKQKVFYAHLVAGSKKISLYLSGNIDNDEVKNFFLNTFKKDFPSFQLVSQDIEFDD